MTGTKHRDAGWLSIARLQFPGHFLPLFARQHFRVSSKHSPPPYNISECPRDVNTKGLSSASPHFEISGAPNSDLKETEETFLFPARPSSWLGSDCTWVVLPAADNGQSFIPMQALDGAPDLRGSCAFPYLVVSDLKSDPLPFAGGESHHFQDDKSFQKL